MTFEKFLTSGCYVFLITCYSLTTSAQSMNSLPSSASISAGTNIRVFPDTVTQVESTIAVHPLNPLIMAGSAVTDVYPGGYTTGVYISTNGGNGWFGTNAIKDSTNKIIVTVGNPKITIDKNGTFILSYVAPDPVTGGKPFKIGVSYSTNNGLYWSRTVYVPGVTDGDKSQCFSDVNPASPYYGRSYITYTSTKAVFFSYSTTGGKSWSAATRICPTRDYSRTGAYLAVGPLGHLYVTWPYLAESSKYIGFAKSTDGGLNWTTSDKAILAYPMRDNFRVYLNLCTMTGLPTLAIDNSGGPRNGWIYVVASEKKKAAGYPALDSGDIVVHISTDKGVTWPLKYRVNQDPVSGNTRSVYQVFPAITVDAAGGVNVIYYDSRNSNPASRDTSEVYLSRSTNGGANFTDIKISNHKFRMQRLPADKMLFGISSYIGTGIGIAASGSNIYPFWFENSANNEYQAWFSNVDLLAPTLNPGGISDNSVSINDRDVTMKWVTASGCCNSGFGIERKVSDSGNWNEIGNVKASESRNTAQQYSFTDRNLTPGKYEYRLRQIDFNDNFEYFNISDKVVIGIPVEFRLSQNYPNPFNPSTTIDFDLPSEGFVTMKIFNASGKEVASLVNETRTAGNHTVNFNASNLSSGVYYCRLKSNRFSKVIRMALIK